MEEVKVVKLDTQPAQTSIKELRAQLKAYKDEMAGLEEGSAEFLKVAQSAGELKHQIDEINETVKGASADFGDMLSAGASTTAGIIGGFQAAQGALTLFGVQSEEVTKAIQKMQASMAIVQGISAIDNGIKAYKKLNEAVKSITVVQQIISSLKKKDTVVETANTAAKTANAVATGAQATANGAATVATEAQTAAQWSLNAAIAANPVGAILTALVALVGVVWGAVKAFKAFIGGESEEEQQQRKLEQAVKDSEKAREKLNRTLEEYARQLDIVNEKNDYELDLLKAQGASDDEISKKFIQNKKDEIKYIKEKQLVAAKAAMEAAQNAILENGGSTRNGMLVGNTDLIQTYREAQTAYNDLVRQINNSQREITLEETKQETQRKKEQEKTRQENAKKAKDDSDKRKQQQAKDAQDALNIELEQNKRSTASKEEKLQVEIDIEKRRLALYKEGSVEYEKQLTTITNLEAKVGEDARKAQEEKEKKAAEDEKRRIEQEQKDIQSLQNKYLTEEELFAADIAKKRELLQQSLEDKVIDEQTYAALSKQIDDEVEKHKEENRQKDIESERAGIAAKINMAAAMANGVADILSSFADMQDENTKEGFENSKKLQIAATTMNMLGGVASAIASCWSPANAWQTSPVQATMAALNAASVIASGSMQINKIKSTTFNNSSSSVSSGAVSSTIIPPVQYSQALQGASTEQTIGDTKAYVAVTEIERVTNKVNVAENESRY